MSQIINGLKSLASLSPFLSAYILAKKAEKFNIEWEKWHGSSTSRQKLILTEDCRAKSRPLNRHFGIPPLVILKEISFFIQKHFFYIWFLHSYSCG